MERSGFGGVQSAQWLSISGTRALAAWTAVTLILWGASAYWFSRELSRVEVEAQAISTRYARAQEQLVGIRARILMESAYEREALQRSEPEKLRRYSRSIRDTSDAIDSVLREYEPLWNSQSELAIIERLKREVQVSRAALRDGVTSNFPAVDETAPVDGQVFPKRRALFGVSDELQSLNRAMFLSQQQQLRGLMKQSEVQLRLGLSIALALSLAACILAAAYAGKLERRLEKQRKAEARHLADLQRLSARVVGVQEEERRTIARDLHDEVGQSLAAIKVELAGAARGGADEERRQAALARARAIADDTIRNVRNLSHLLHPPLLEGLGLSLALEHYVREFGRRHSLLVDFAVDAEDARLGLEMEQAIYRMVQEALTNVAKHARARTCWVSLRRRTDAIVLTVSDDGVGMPTSAEGRPATSDGLGLIGIEERAACFNGTVDISVRDGGGAMLSVVLPVRQEE